MLEGPGHLKHHSEENSSLWILFSVLRKLLHPLPGFCNWTSLMGMSWHPWVSPLFWSNWPVSWRRCWWKEDGETESTDQEDPHAENSLLFPLAGFWFGVSLFALGPHGLANWNAAHELGQYGHWVEAGLPDCPSACPASSSQPSTWGTIEYPDRFSFAYTKSPITS